MERMFSKLFSMFGELFSKICSFISRMFLINCYKTQDQNKVHEAKAIVLTCMDFRLIDDMVKMMNELGYNNNYDQFILAGASLGYNEGETPVKKSCTKEDCNCIIPTNWKPIFKNHIKLASDLHEISEIIIIDHYKCGAYRIMSPKLNTDDTEKNQLDVHQIQLFKAKKDLEIFRDKLIKNTKLEKTKLEKTTLDIQTLDIQTLDKNKIIELEQKIKENEDELKKNTTQINNLANLKIRLFMMRVDGSYHEILYEKNENHLS